MKTEDKNKYQVQFHKALLEIGNIADPVVQGIELFNKLAEIIEEIYGKGQRDGFTEGYAEAKKKLEQKFGKLN